MFVLFLFFQIFSEMRQNYGKWRTDEWFPGVKEEIGDGRELCLWLYKGIKRDPFEDEIKFCIMTVSMSVSWL